MKFRSVHPFHVCSERFRYALLEKGKMADLKLPIQSYYNQHGQQLIEKKNKQLDKNSQDIFTELEQVDDLEHCAVLGYN